MRFPVLFIFYLFLVKWLAVKSLRNDQNCVGSGVKRHSIGLLRLFAKVLNKLLCILCIDCIFIFIVYFWLNFWCRKCMCFYESLCPVSQLCLGCCCAVLSLFITVKLINYDDHGGGGNDDDFWFIHSVIHLLKQTNKQEHEAVNESRTARPAFYESCMALTAARTA